MGLQKRMTYPVDGLFNQYTNFTNPGSLQSNVLQNRSYFERNAYRTQERTGFRHQDISQEHRNWGVALMATDIDFVLAEYERDRYGKIRVAAIVEYKKETAPPFDPTDPQLDVLTQLANGVNACMFYVRYSVAPWNFHLKAINKKARSYMTSDWTRASMANYVKLLYQVRGEEMPGDIYRYCIARS